MMEDDVDDEEEDDDDSEDLCGPHMSLWILIPSDGGLCWTSMKSMTLLG